jgi:glycosyltransferase involved in cell wall biosynthesis
MTIWYDVTTSLRATSRNGIANVEWSLGLALREYEPGVRFFALWGRGGLVEIDPDHDLAEAFYASDERPPATVTIAEPTWHNSVRVLLHRVLGHRAATVIRLLSPMLQVPRRALRRLKARPRTGIRLPGVRLLEAVTGGDVVVSMGADWEGDVAAHLGQLRERTGCRVVMMVYDLIPLTHTHLAFHKDPKLFERYYTELIGVSDLVTCISEQTRSDLLHFGTSRNLHVPRTEFLRLGETEPPSPPGTDRERGGFYLSVGTIERRKNLELLYDALRILESEGSELPTVVVAGSIGWGTRDLMYELELQSTQASRSIVMLGPVEDATLDLLYARAKALLFPSHYEGWGLPVREAAVRGLPVAAGDSPAVREAAAGYSGATLLPVDDPGPWADYLRKAPSPAEPVPVYPWSASAARLLELVGHRP